MKMESNDSDSSCIITDVIENWERVLKITVKEPFLKKCKLEYEGFRIMSIPGDGHCIAYCFATHFKEPLDRVVDHLNSEFREKHYFLQRFL